MHQPGSLMRVWNIGMLALLVVLSYLWLAGTGGLLQQWQQEEEVRQLTTQNAAGAERNSRLEASLTGLGDGTDEIEEQARQNLGMIRDDETFYQMVEPATEPER